MMKQAVIRRLAAAACADLLEINLATGVGDLFVGTEGWNDLERRWFVEYAERTIEQLRGTR